MQLPLATLRTEGLDDVGVQRDERVEPITTVLAQAGKPGSGFRADSSRSKVQPQSFGKVPKPFTTSALSEKAWFLNALEASGLVPQVPTALGLGSWADECRLRPDP